MQKLHPCRLAAPAGFFLGSPNVRSGCLHVHGRVDPVGQEFMVQYSNAGADVEERVGACMRFTQQPKDQPGGALGSMSSVRRQFLLGARGSEVTISCRTVARHGSSV